MGGNQGVLPRILDIRVLRRFLNPNPIIRTKKVKTDTLFKSQTLKMIPYSRQKLLTGKKGKLYSFSVALHDERFHTPVVDNTI